MNREPRSRGSGVLTGADWTYITGVGMVMMIGTVAVLDAYYPGGLFTLFAKGSAANVADETYARTMAFTTLMMFQLFNVYNCRSAWRSAFAGFFENRWLIVSVLFSLATHVAVIYVPFLQTAFHTVPLTLNDWAITAGIGATLLAAVELVKVVLRAQRRPPAPAAVRAHPQMSARESR
jgi:Ca2+-transporting ATPase